jgi:hypothetical protein
MSTTTYKVRFAGQLSGKRFQDALKLVKDAGGTYDEATRTWTVVAGDTTTTTRTCSLCMGTGHPVLNAASRDGQECAGAPCTQHGPHKHAAYTCPECKGAGTRNTTNMPRELALLRTAEQSYGAQVTAMDDDSTGALRAERARLAARIAEIDKLLGA